MSSTEQIEAGAQALASNDGMTWEDMPDFERVSYRDKATVVLATVPARRPGVKTPDEVMQRRVQILAAAFERGVPMARALRAAEPDLAAGYVPLLVARTRAWDAEHDNALRGAGRWDYKENGGVRYEVTLSDRDGHSLRWRFASIAACQEWLPGAAARLAD